MFDVSAPATEMDVLTSAANGMSVQRAMLDVAARNVAAAQASTPGHSYSRLVAEAGRSIDPPEGEDGPDEDGAIAPAALSVRSEPGSGDALSEMIAVLDAQRAYEQNASVFDIGKRLAERTIDIGRG